MTERSFGQSGFHFFTGEVFSRKDPNQAGRLQIRIHGLHDDTTNVPDDQLPWAKQLMPVTSSSSNNVGSSPTGIQEKQVIFGFFLDHDKQIPVVMGSFHRDSEN